VLAFVFSGQPDKYNTNKQQQKLNPNLSLELPEYRQTEII